MTIEEKIKKVEEIIQHYINLSEAEKNGLRINLNYVKIQIVASSMTALSMVAIALKCWQ